MSRGLTTKAIVGVLLFGLLPGVPGCGNSSDRTTPSEGRHSLVVGFPSGPDQLDLMTYRSARSALIFEGFLSQTLLERDEERGSLKPALAAALPRREGSTLFWDLRPEARFSDGSPVRASDVKRSVDALLLGEASGRQRSCVEGIQEIEILDEHRFLVRWKNVSYLQSERFGTTLVVRSEKGGTDARDLVGCGPFTLSGARTDETTLRRLDSWWGDRVPELAGRFALDELRLRYLKDQESLPYLLNEGVLDLVPLSFAQVGALGADGITVASFTTDSFSFLGWNCRGGATRSAPLRRILSRMIPRKQVAAQLQGLTVHPGLFRADDELAQSPPVSDRELEEVGLRDLDGDGLREWQGVPFELRLVVPQGRSPWLETTLSRWQDVLAQRGVTLRVERLTLSPLLQRLRTRDFTAFALVWRVREVEPSFRALLHSSMSGPGGRNFTGLADGELDELLDRLESHQDPSERRVLRRRLARRLGQLVPLLPLYRHKACLGYRSDRISFQMGPRGIIWWSLKVRH